MEKIFKLITCTECHQVYGAVLIPDNDEIPNSISYYCFDCAYSFAMVNEILETDFCQSVKQFKQDCSKETLWYEIQSNGHLLQSKIRLWMVTVRMWYENENKQHTKEKTN